MNNLVGITSGNGKSVWRDAVKEKAKDCRQLMSKDTAEISDEVEVYEHKEVHNYLAYLYKNIKYMANNPDMAQHLKEVAEECEKVKVDIEGTESNVDAKFPNCLHEKMKAEEE